MINILITSFKDEDINNTIDSLIKNSVDENKLRFKLLFVENNNLDGKFLNDPRFEIITIPKNRGVGFSRKILTTNLPKNEYFLQLDSHHRFIKHWDEVLIGNYLKHKESTEKVVISTSLPPFEGDQHYSNCFTVTKLDSYTNNGIPKLISTCGNTNGETGLICAHFFFGETSVFDEIKYKDSWYFFGEEILLSLYAHKHGYKVFSPEQIIAWHRYKLGSDTIERDLTIENKLSKYVNMEIKSLYSDEFSKLIGVDFLNFKCSHRNYFIHGAYGFDIIQIITPNNQTITFQNIDNHEIFKFSGEGFFKGAILHNTKLNIKKYFSLSS